MFKASLLDRMFAEFSELLDDHLAARWLPDGL